MSTKELTRIFAPFSLKARDDNARTFEGIAAAYSLDLGGDVIHPGAFKRTLDHWKSSGRVFPLLDQHPEFAFLSSHSVTRDTLGKMLDAEEREGEGLWAKFQIAKTRAGDDLMSLLSDGMVEGLSIGYEAISPTRDSDGIRHLTEIKLTEVSVVTWGANPDALIDLGSVKSMVGKLSEAQKAQFRALLAEPAKPESAGLAPDDPQRIAMDETLRAIQLRTLATRV